MTINPILKKLIKLYESGNEDEINNNDKTIESINDNIQQKEIENLQRENQTLKQMVENRNQEIQKPKESDDKIQALSNVLGINRINERIDELNQSQNSLIGKMSEMIQGMNSISNAINGNKQASIGPEVSSGDPMAKMELISGLLSKAGEFYSIYKQNQTPTNQPALIDQEFINKRMVESFMEDLDTGKSISTFIKNSLKKTATKNIVNTALKDIGHDDDPA